MKGWYPGGCSFEIWKMYKHNICIYIYTHILGGRIHICTYVYIYIEICCLLVCMLVCLHIQHVYQLTRLGWWIGAAGGLISSYAYRLEMMVLLKFFSNLCKIRVVFSETYRKKVGYSKLLNHLSTSVSTLWHASEDDPWVMVCHD